MKKIILLFTALLIAACAGEHQKIDYKYKEHKFQYGNCDTIKYECAELSIKTLEIAADKLPAADSIVNDVNNFIFAHSFDPDRRRLYSSVEEYRDSFFAEYKRFKSEFPDSYAGFSVNKEVDVVYDSLRLFCISLSQYEFMGGAHGNYFKTFHNYELASGRKITLEEILMEDFEPKLNSIAELEFRKIRQIPEGTGYEEAGFWFENNKFSLNRNFAITNEELLFYFNHYEIGPYVMGSTELPIKWTDIKNLVRPEGVLKRIVK
jgi:hypothetical protein